MSTEPGKGNDGILSGEGDSLPILPKVSDKSAGGHPMQPPIFPFGAGLPSSRVNIPDSPADLPGDPLKEGASTRIDDKVVPEAEKGNFGEALKGLDPSMSEEKRDAFASFLTAASSGEPLSDSSKQEIKGEWGRLHVPQEEAKGAIAGSNLSIKDKIEMNEWAEEHLSPISKEEQQESLPQNEQEQIQANVGAMGEQLEQMKEQAEEAKGHSEGKHHSEKVERMLEKIEELREKMDEFLHPEDPLKTWATRGGKTLYVILMVSFLFVIWEMNIINRMAGGKRGGGH